VPERELELGTQSGERRAQLVAGVVDEAAFVLDRRLEPGEHLVQGLGEPRELVPALRNRQAGPGRRRTDRGSSPAHRFHRTKGGRGEQVAAERDDHERERTADHELA
jgi:hypothetical protein